MGKVPFCTLDYDAKDDYGNVNEQSIAEIWRSEKWNRVRQLHATGQRNDFAFCHGCKLFDLDASLENWQQKELYDS